MLISPLLIYGLEDHWGPFNRIRNLTRADRPAEFEPENSRSWIQSINPQSHSPSISEAFKWLIFTVYTVEYLKIQAPIVLVKDGIIKSKILIKTNLRVAKRENYTAA